MIFLKSYSQNKSAQKKFFTPYTYEEKLLAYKKHNAKVRAKYYKLANTHKEKHKLHIVFTTPIQGDRYIRLENILVIKHRFNKLIKNLKLQSLYHFQNIEIGENYDNPHLDIQIWLNELDVDKVFKVYCKVLSGYRLEESFCKFNEYDKNISETNLFHYSVKEYKRSLSDKEIYKLGEARKDYRKVLGKRVRFYSHTRNEFTQKVYKSLYKKYGLTYSEADYVLENEIIKVSDNSKLSLNILKIAELKKRHLVNIFNKLKKNILHKQKIAKESIKKRLSKLYWLFGYI